MSNIDKEIKEIIFNIFITYFKNKKFHLESYDCSYKHNFYIVTNTQNKFLCTYEEENNECSYITIDLKSYIRDNKDISGILKDIFNHSHLDILLVGIRFYYSDDHFELYIYDDEIKKSTGFDFKKFIKKIIKLRGKVI